MALEAVTAGAGRVRRGGPADAAGGPRPADPARSRRPDRSRQQTRSGRATSAADSVGGSAPAVAAAGAVVAADTGPSTAGGATPAACHARPAPVGPAVGAGRGRRGGAGGRRARPGAAGATAGEDASRHPASAAAQVAPPVADRLIASGPRLHSGVRSALGVPAGGAADVPPDRPTAPRSVRSAAPEPADPRATGRRADLRLAARPAPRAGRPRLLSDAIAAEHGGGPVTVDAVDYAAFQGAPALIVEFVDGRGERWACATRTRPAASVPTRTSACGPG